MLKVLVFATQNNVSDARMEYLIRDRLSWLRLREKLTEGGALDLLFVDFDRQLKERGDLAMGEASPRFRRSEGSLERRSGGGQIADATLVAAPKQRNTAPEKDAIKQGKTASEIWPDRPARAAQKDTEARWTLRFAKAKPLANGKPGIDIAFPSFGYKSGVSICRTFGFFRECKVSDGIAAPKNRKNRQKMPNGGP